MILCQHEDRTVSVFDNAASCWWRLVAIASSFAPASIAANASLVGIDSPLYAFLIATTGGPFRFFIIAKIKQGVEELSKLPHCQQVHRNC